MLTRRKPSGHRGAVSPRKMAALLAVMLPLAGCAGRTDVTTGPDQARNVPPDSAHQHSGGHSAETDASGQVPKVPPPDPGQAEVPSGFKVEVVMSGLTYPTSVEFDSKGNLYVAEGGYSYGDADARPRIIRISSDGKAQVAAKGDALTGPVNDLLWHDDKLYISHRGKISVLQDKGKVRDLVTGLPSEGDHQNNQMTVGPDGRIYFGQGTATNSGVVGIDNFKMGWLKKHPEFHDIPARDVKLMGRTYETPNPLTRMEEQVKTSAYHPFTKAVPEGATIAGQTRAGGTVLRMNPDGSDLQVHAWGLRNPFGVMWSPQGTLYATENGFDARGSRPIANDKEDIYVIKDDGWYGWPDFAMGLPVTDPRFKPEGKPQPQFVMAEHPAVEKPWLNFPRHAAITKLDFATHEAFGKGQMFVAFFGHMTPMTGTAPQEHGGHRVVRIDPATKKVQTFFSQKGHAGQGQGGQGQGGQGGGHEQGSGGHDQVQQQGQAQGQQQGGHHGGGQQHESVSAGPRRLIDVRFSPQGNALYIADFGAMLVSEKVKPIPGSGVIWRVVPENVNPSGPPAGLSALRSDMNQK